MAGSKDQNPEDELRVVEEEEVIRLESPGSKNLEKRGKITTRSLNEATRSVERGKRAGSEEGENSDYLDLLEDLEEEETAVPMGWFFLLGLGLLAVVVWMGFQIFGRPGESEDLNAVSAEASDLSGQEARREAEEHFLAMEEVLVGFFSAETIEERLEFVRHPDRVGPLMQGYHGEKEFKTYHFEGIESYHSITVSKRPFVAMGAATREHGTLPILVEDAEGGCLVDWESFVCYNSMSPEDFLKGKPNAPVDFRVYATSEEFYAYQFGDEREYRCFRLTFRDSDAFLYGYVKRGTSVAQKFRDLFGDGRSKVLKPLILSLRFPEGGKGERSVIIEDVVSSLWAYGVDPAAGQPAGAAR